MKGNKKLEFVIAAEAPPLPREIKPSPERIEKSKEERKHISRLETKLKVEDKKKKDIIDSNRSLEQLLRIQDGKIQTFIEEGRQLRQINDSLFKENKQLFLKIDGFVAEKNHLLADNKLLKEQLKRMEVKLQLPFKPSSRKTSLKGKEEFSRDNNYIDGSLLQNELTLQELGSKGYSSALGEFTLQESAQFKKMINLGSNNEQDNLKLIEDEKQTNQQAQKISELEQEIENHKYEIKLLSMALSKQDQGDEVQNLINQLVESQQKISEHQKNHALLEERIIQFESLVQQYMSNDPREMDRASLEQKNAFLLQENKELGETLKGLKEQVSFWQSNSIELEKENFNNNNNNNFNFNNNNNSNNNLPYDFQQQPFNLPTQQNTRYQQNIDSDDDERIKKAKLAENQRNDRQDNINDQNNTNQRNNSANSKKSGKITLAASISNQTNKFKDAVTPTSNKNNTSMSNKNNNTSINNNINNNSMNNNNTSMNNNKLTKGTSKKNTKEEQLDSLIISPRTFQNMGIGDSKSILKQNKSNATISTINNIRQSSNNLNTINSDEIQRKGVEELLNMIKVEKNKNAILQKMLEEDQVKLSEHSVSQEEITFYKNKNKSLTSENLNLQKQIYERTIQNNNNSISTTNIRQSISPKNRNLDTSKNKSIISGLTGKQDTANNNVTNMASSLSPRRGTSPSARNKQNSQILVSEEEDVRELAFKQIEKELNQELQKKEKQIENILNSRNLMQKTLGDSLKNIKEQNKELKESNQHLENQLFICKQEIDSLKSLVRRAERKNLLGEKSS